MKPTLPAACLVVLASLVASLPTGDKTQDVAFWKETPMDGAVQELELKCGQRNDPISCLKFKVLSLLDEVFRKDSYKVGRINTALSFINHRNFVDRLCALVVGVRGYRSRGPRSIPGATAFSEK
jgi:hypothetical protein